jgi:hypothetical protein
MIYQAFDERAHEIEVIASEFEQLHSETRLRFAALAGQVSRKREHEPWSPEENPGKALTCRALIPPE